MSPAFSAVYVSDLKAAYRNGQAFLTWKCPEGTNYLYKVYRSTNKLNLQSEINESTYIGGYVRDSSSLNLRLTRKTGAPVYYIIEDGAAPLTASDGLYVITCDSEDGFFYAVTVTDLTKNKEFTSITLGSNSLDKKIIEHVADPQPVFQGTVEFTSTNETAYRYVQFGDHRNLPHYPYMFNKGSYGFNFNIVYRGNYENGSLYVFYEGLEGKALVGNGLGAFEDISDCIIISLDDWLPVPNGYLSSSGIPTYWGGYHEDFDPYSLSNPIPIEGVVRMYQQHRFIHTIDWAMKYLPIDSQQINLIGVSAGGFGALLTALIVPGKISAVYAVVAPIVIKSYSFDTDSSDVQMWGCGKDNLETDIPDPVTGAPLRIFDLMNIKSMLSSCSSEGLPVIYTIHGKNDETIYWSDKPNYLNQNDNYWQGGTHFWDQRGHDGSGANFFDSETTPPFQKLRRNLSYPAFSNCDVNEDPGNGNSGNGDPYGSFNGYLDFDETTEDACKWTGHMSVRDFTVGGEEITSYSTVYADVTLRRLQAFQPEDGVTLKWSTYDKNDDKLQNGSFVYNCGSNITIPGIKFKKSGIRLEVYIKNCSMRAEEEGDIEYEISEELTVMNSYDGWIVNFNSLNESPAQLQLVDITGRIVGIKSIGIHEGNNQIQLQAPAHGSFIIRIQQGNQSREAKVIY